MIKKKEMCEKRNIGYDISDLSSAIIAEIQRIREVRTSSKNRRTGKHHGYIKNAKTHVYFFLKSPRRIYALLPGSSSVKKLISNHWKLLE